MYFDSLWVRFDVCPCWFQVYRYSKMRYYRKIHSVQRERERFYVDAEIGKEYGFVLTRAARSPYWLNSWRWERPLSCTETKSWKKIYKVKHQWEKPKYQHELYYEIIKS